VETKPSPLTKKIVSAIGKCCSDEGIQPVDLTHGVFVRYLKETMEMDAGELRSVRLHLQRVGGLTNLRNSFYSADPSPSVFEREDMRAVSKIVKANTLSMANDEKFLTRLSDIMSKVSKDLSKRAVPTLGKTAKTKTKTNRVVTLMLSDLHFGSKLDPREVPYKYDLEEEARALASIVVRLCEFKEDHRNESELIIWLGGDLISGKIHDKQVGAPCAEQLADATWLLLQAIRIAAKHWKKVTVYCSTGNHDRDPSRHLDRALDQKFDSKATQVYFAIKLAVDHLPNVTVNIPRTAYCEWTSFGHPNYFTHGDTGLNVGNPSRRINIDAIDSQMKTINLARVSQGKKPYEVFGVGHLHQGMHLPLPAGQLIINPAMTPVNGYAESVGYALSRPGQTLFECDKEHAVGDLRFMFIEPDMLKDKALSKIILPFQDF